MNKESLDIKEIIATQNELKARAERIVDSLYIDGHFSIFNLIFHIDSLNRIVDKICSLNQELDSKLHEKS